jgi:hypothetical protein
MKEQGQGLEMVGWRTHRLNEHQEVLKRWHNKPPSPVEDRAGEYFYARFVWDIFPLIQGFHHGGPPRRLVVYNQSQCKYEVKMLTKAERRIFTLNQGRTRSVSPTKRQRSAQPGDRSERSGGSTYRRSAFKKQRLSPLDRSQDSAIAGFQNWTGDSDIVALQDLLTFYFRGCQMTPNLIEVDRERGDNEFVDCQSDIQ